MNEPLKPSLTDIPTLSIAKERLAALLVEDWDLFHELGREFARRVL